jgi:hypothetical protein
LGAADQRKVRAWAVCLAAAFFERAAGATPPPVAEPWHLS